MKKLSPKHREVAAALLRKQHLTVFEKKLLKYLQRLSKEKT